MATPEELETATTRIPAPEAKPVVKPVIPLPKPPVLKPMGGAPVPPKPIPLNKSVPHAAPQPINLAKPAGAATANTGTGKIGKVAETQTRRTMKIQMDKTQETPKPTSDDRTVRVQKITPPPTAATTTQKLTPPPAPTAAANVTAPGATPTMKFNPPPKPTPATTVTPLKPVTAPTGAAAPLNKPTTAPTGVQRPNNSSAKPAEKNAKPDFEEPVPGSETFVKFVAVVILLAGLAMTIAQYCDFNFGTDLASIFSFIK